LILDAADRLYLHRFWCYQQDLARDLRERAGLPPRRFNEARLQRSLDRLDASVTGFGAVSPLILGTAALCRVCVVQASSSIWADLLSSLLVVIGEQLNRRLSLLIAGPGTQRDLLATLLARVVKDPTLSGEERAQLPAEPMILEHLPRDRYRNRQDSIGQEPPLRADLVMVVGAEAADLVMLAGLVRNLPPYTRLVLLGDGRRIARPEYAPFAALLAGPGQSAAFRERLGQLLGERLASGGAAVNALQNAVVTPQTVTPAVRAGGLYQAFWESPAGSRDTDCNAEE
jgi:exodeoxyribonuclease V alpha subunit